MKKSFLLIFLATTCLGPIIGPKQVDEPYISDIDCVYLSFAANSNGVVIDGIIEDEIPREEVVDTQYFKYKKTVKFYEIYNTDTTCVIPYLNYVYIVDFFGTFHPGDTIRYNDFAMIPCFNFHRRNSNKTFEWRDSTYQHYWMEPAYIRKEDAARMIAENTVIPTPIPQEEEYDEDDEEEDDEEDEQE